jgi:hypothetical protein
MRFFFIYDLILPEKYKILQKNALFRAGKEGNMLLPVRRKSDQIKTPNN